MRAAICIFAIGFAASAQAATYPDKPIRLIVPFAAGGGVDVVARLVSQKYAEALGQQMVIDNRGGSGGVIAADIAAHSVPDGYTLFLGGSASHGITPHLYRKLPYDAVRFRAGEPDRRSAALSHRQSGGAGDDGEGTTRTRAGETRPAQLRLGGNGQHAAFTAELFRSMANIKIVHVPLKAAPCAYRSARGQLQLMFAPAALALPQRAPALRALGVSSEKRAPFAPEIPTIAETGVPGFAATGWYGLLGPRSLPQLVTNKLYQTMANIYTDKEFNERCATVGVVPLKGNPAEFARFIQSELAKWGKVVRESGARID
jgi:tripartite-type tricarboxylate transporter receptor subunit TctC